MSGKGILSGKGIRGRYGSVARAQGLRLHRRRIHRLPRPQRLRCRNLSGGKDRGDQHSDSSYLVNCMRRGWYKKWQENGWLNHRNEPVANRDLWERLQEATQRHKEVRWRKVRGHSKTQGPHKSGNDRADELAVAAKKGATRPPAPPSR